MKIYTVNSSEIEIEEHFTTKAAAMKHASALKTANNDAYVEVCVHEVVKLTKEALCEILDSNGGRWAATSETVKVF